MFGQGQLHEDTVDVEILVEFIDTEEEFLFGNF